MMNALPKISRLHKGDLPSLLALSQQAGWPHTVRDWTAVLECGTGYGHRRSSAADDDNVVSCLHMTDCGKGFASLGLVVVDEAYRGQGMGTALVKHALSHRPPSQSIGLVAGANVSSFYEPFGFQSMEDEHILILRKEIGLATPASVGVPDSSPDHNLRSLSPENLKEVLDFDLQVTGLERTKLMQQRLSNADCSLMYATTDNIIQGYGMANVQDGSLTIGPLVALDTPTALQLAFHLAEDHGNKHSNNETMPCPSFIRIDAYTSQSEFVDGLVNMGYQVTPQQAVMIKGPFLKLPGNRNHIYVPASQAWM